MEELHEIERSLIYLKSGYYIKLLPNYNKKRERQKDILETFFLFYQHGDEKSYFFDDQDDPIPENLKVELFNTHYLSKMNLCYALIKSDEDDVPVFVILNLSYKFLNHFASTINDYYDIEEYPWFKVETYLDTDTNEMKENEIQIFDQETMFESDDIMIDYIIKNSTAMMSMTIENLIKKYSWNSYGDELTNFFRSNPSLKEYSNLFRIKKIKNFFNNTD